MAKYLDNNGLLYVLTDILNKLKAKQDVLTISEVISSDSTNQTVPGAKAVYDYVSSAVASMTGLSAQIVTELPTVGQNNVLYLIAKASAAESDAYDEYMWINGGWELIGTTAVDLSGYLKASDISDWAKAEIKPGYTADEVGAAKSVHTHKTADISDLEALTNSEIDDIIALAEG